LVKPERSTVSEFCTELTTLTQEQVDQGMSFAEACERLQKRYLSNQGTQTDPRLLGEVGDLA
jgi:inhibitor of KinA sporulation pathway (predicted exonuclease)